jgi:hypothetical protein
MEILSRIFNWRTARSVGELQILTRASYIMLIVVPMLAGTWPTVRIIINSYNRFMEESAVRLDKAANALESQATNVRMAVQDTTTTDTGATINSSAERIEDLARVVETELMRLRRQATLSPFLPPSWALAFFAAVSVVLGQVVYQSGAPEIVRRQTADDFVRSATEEYRNNPTERLLEYYERRASDYLPNARALGQPRPRVYRPEDNVF